MKKSFWKKGLTMGMVCTMVFTSACGKKETAPEQEKTKVESKIDKDHVYRMEDIELPVNGDSYIQNCCTTKENFYTLVDFYGGDEDEISLLKMGFDTENVEKVPLDTEGNTSYRCLAVDEKENLYLIKTVYSDEYMAKIQAMEDEEESDEEVVSDSESAETEEETSVEEAASKEDEDSDKATEEEDSASNNEENVEAATEDTIISEETSDSDVKTTMVKLSPSGDVIWDQPLTESDAKAYVRSMIYVKDKGILTQSSGKFSLYDENTGEGKQIAERKPDGDDDYYYAYMYAMRDDSIYIYEDNWDGDSTGLVKFNPDNMSFDGEASLPEGVYGGSSLYPGKCYDFYIADSTSISAFNIGDEKTTLICDLTSSDILSNYFSYVGDDESGKLYVLNNDEESKPMLASMVKVDPSEIADKETITIGTVWTPMDVRKQVVRFNRKSDKYRISLIDYAEDNMDDTGDAYSDSINKLGLDLVQGQGPDMLIVDYDMPIQSYAEKGVFEPLDSYIENDTDIQLSDYVTNIVDSTRVGGKLYTVVPSFSVSTCVAAKDNVGDEKVTLGNYKDICEKNGIDPAVGMGAMTRNSASELYATTGTTYIDYENATCNYDSEGFVDLLKFVKQFPEEMDEDMDYEEYDTYYRENKSLLLSYIISSFKEYQVLEKGYFGKDIVFNGFPTVDGGESYISVNTQIAMNKDCKNKEAAWEFMKSFLVDDYQDRLDYGFPIKTSALEAQAEKAQHKPYYIDSDGKKVETSESWHAGGQDIEITEMSKEETGKLMDFIKSLTNTVSYENKIWTIIYEEADAFYEDQKSAEEVADIIQSRVSIYLSENR
ncbi:ABC transporter substrate-binding protein [Butyrivibrio sp. WCE2006]|uniref:ABC transporter substrate-binding protein n=1 Tax=Butyrivibrio sp. WCE2006 TaxID=1410611 RepID=UPI0005D1552D|nr:extracellular solute-binding protein [Butyrivibrio sp. WCE2006]